MCPCSEKFPWNRNPRHPKLGRVYLIIHQPLPQIRTTDPTPPPPRGVVLGPAGAGSPGRPRPARGGLRGGKTENTSFHSRPLKRFGDLGGNGVVLFWSGRFCLYFWGEIESTTDSSHWTPLGSLETERISGRCPSVRTNRWPLRCRTPVAATGPLVHPKTQQKPPQRPHEPPNTPPTCSIPVISGPTPSVPHRARLRRAVAQVTRQTCKSRLA